MTTVSLYAGTPSNATSQGTAALYLVLHDPGPATRIVSLTLRAAGESLAPIFQCSSLTSCSAPSSLVVNGYGDTGFSNSTSAFFIGSQVNENSTYTYAIVLANGQTISGSVVAFSKIAKP